MYKSLKLIKQNVQDILWKQKKFKNIGKQQYI